MLTDLLKNDTLVSNEDLKFGLGSIALAYKKGCLALPGCSSNKLDPSETVF